MKQLLLAFQFLTIVPVRVNDGVSEKEIAQSAAFFPLAGAFQGLLALLSAMLFLKIFSSEIAAGLTISVLIMSNGGFHLDGLADTFDAIAVKSTGNAAQDIEKRLAVMKDSTTGAIGVVAIVSVILLKFLFISSLFTNSSIFTVYSMLFLMPVFSKWIMVTAMHHGTSARQDGLGRIFLNNVNMNTVVFSSLLVIVLYILIAELHLLKVYGTGSVTLFIMLFALLYMFSFMTVKFCNKKFNGLTGDNLGALSEISEILFLMVITVWLRHFI
jgi:adenosylcobinamide-GDP ribazoletransferase